MTEPRNVPEEEWRRRLTPEQYHVCREKGTEKPFTGAFWNCTDDGVYCCVACGAELFRSDQKYDAGCGWPSFFDALDPERITRVEDHSHDMHRIEILCSTCGSHLGHVFADGPEPTGERYCVNSLSLDLKRSQGKKDGEEDAG